MSKRLIPTLMMLAITVCAGAALADIAIILSGPLWPWFSWMLP